MNYTKSGVKLNSGKQVQIVYSICRLKL